MYKENPFTRWKYVTDESGWILMFSEPEAKEYIETRLIK